VGSFKTADNKTTMLQFITKKLVTKNPEFRTDIPKIIAIMSGPNDMNELRGRYNKVKKLTAKIDETFAVVEGFKEGDDDWKAVCKKQI
jgi:hypothetical protein